MTRSLAEEISPALLHFASHLGLALSHYNVHSTINHRKKRVLEKRELFGGSVLWVDLMKNYILGFGLPKKEVDSVTCVGFTTRGTIQRRIGRGFQLKSLVG